MRRRLACLALCAAFVVAAVAGSAGAAPSQRRPPGAPDLAAMALTASDLPGARVTRQGYLRNPDFLATYERELSLAGARLGRSRLILVTTELNVGRTLAAARDAFAALSRTVRVRRFRDDLAAIVALEAGLSPRAVTVGRPRTPRIGDGAVTFPIRVRQRGIAVSLVVTVLRDDRVLASILVLGAPGRRLFPADVDRLSRIASDRIRAGLVPRPTGPPLLVRASPGLGVTLSTSTGTWSGDSVVFTYQWERCTGDLPSGCAPIPGATASTYTILAADLTSTVRVTVTGSNRLGSATSSSSTTEIVAGPPGSPTPLTPPLVGGVFGFGATLTATTGTWAGAPTSFAYQWRRCNAATGACVDVVGATGASYTLTAADSGSLLRVLVVATNTAGPGGALSAPTAAAP